MFQLQEGEYDEMAARAQSAVAAAIDAGGWFCCNHTLRRRPNSSFLSGCFLSEASEAEWTELLDRDRADVRQNCNEQASFALALSPPWHHIAYPILLLPIPHLWVRVIGVCLLDLWLTVIVRERRSAGSGSTVRVCSVSVALLRTDPMRTQPDSLLKLGG